MLYTFPLKNLVFYLLHKIPFLWFVERYLIQWLKKVSILLLHLFFFCLLNIADLSMLWAQIPLLPGVSIICFFKTNYSKPQWLITIIYRISQGLLVRRSQTESSPLGSLMWLWPASNYGDRYLKTSLGRHPQWFSHMAGSWRWLVAESSAGLLMKKFCGISLPIQ